MASIIYGVDNGLAYGLVMMVSMASSCMILDNVDGYDNDGLVQDCDISTTDALKIPQSFIKPW